MKRVLVNLSNLHVGGGVQVAVSFLEDLSKIVPLLDNNILYSVFYSTAVKENLSLNFCSSVFENITEVNLFQAGFLSKEKRELFSGFDLCFTLFGPLYFKPRVKKHICGFAQAWIAYPENLAYQKLSFKNWFFNKIKFKFQFILFRSYDHLIVEQVHVKNALVNLGIASTEIYVVDNCISDIYNHPESWLPIEFNMDLLFNKITLGFIGRAFSHKNVKILGEVNEILFSKYNMDCNFLFSFTEEEMDSCEFDCLSNFYSTGPLQVSQCPNFYNLIDALVFPSLLECFSASPIEALKMNTTVIASDLPFVKDVCSDSAFYFDPLNKEDIAHTIFTVFSDNSLRQSKKKIGHEIIKSLPTSKDRADSYVSIINEVI